MKKKETYNMGRSPCCDETALKKGLNRCGKSCRLRWTNYLRLDIKRGKFSQDEEQTILNNPQSPFHPWQQKKLIQMGYDSMTHKPQADIFSSLPHLIAWANMKELMENNHYTWDEQAVRLQAEMAKLQYLQYLLQPPLTIASSSSSLTGTPLISLTH
ncbi:hypothetical protein Q3G72_026226 [Acer saccharum]|nr:hypothetical protein Q3G72_026226 [Acer saccharum]